MSDDLDRIYRRFLSEENPGRVHKPVPAGIAAAFKDLTGGDIETALEELPPETPSTPTVLVDKTVDLNTVRAPSNYLVNPAARRDVAEHDIRQYMDLIEYYDVSQNFDVRYSPYASRAARDRFAYDLGDAHTRLETLGIGRLVTYRVELAVFDEQGIAGLYHPSPTDLIQVGLMTATSHGGTYLKVSLHEAGHRFHFCANRYEMDPMIRVVYKYAMRTGDLIITNYSRTDIQEYWAEWFCHYFSGQTQNEYMIKWIQQMVRHFKWF